jgi:hypothetical protein
MAQAHSRIYGSGFVTGEIGGGPHRLDSFSGLRIYISGQRVVC